MIEVQLTEQVTGDRWLHQADGEVDRRGSLSRYHRSALVRTAARRALVRQHRHHPHPHRLLPAVEPRGRVGGWE